MENDKIPYLPNGEIDYELIEKEDLFCHFSLPQIYNTPEDILEFIKSRDVNVPVTKNILELREKKRLEITPTEEKVYFEEIFGYIYSCYRDPRESTNLKVERWLKDYIEKELIFGGFEYFKKLAFKETNWNFFRDKKYGVKKEEINCYKSIVVGGTTLSSSDKDRRTKFVESFLLKLIKSRFSLIIQGMKLTRMLRFFLIEFTFRGVTI